MKGILIYGPRAVLLLVLLILSAAVASAADERGIKHDAPLDMDGDGKTDLVLVRVGEGGRLMWYCAMNSGEIEVPIGWGRFGQDGLDLLISGDYDGDGKDDIAVWRSGPQGVFYVLNSSTHTMTIAELGTLNDNPMVVGDYNGDGRDDFAVYRPGTSSSKQSYWYYKTDANSYFVTVALGEFRDWANYADRPAPGDYDGDGKADFVVRKREQDGTGVYHILLSTGFYRVEAFGNPGEDSITVPGDYDGDFRTDLATITITNDSSRSFLWRYRSSIDGSITEAKWGIFTGSIDYVAPGDYDGDGRCDFAVWRPGAFVPGGVGRFYIMTSGTGQIITYDWGATRDYPVANFNAGPCFWCWVW